MEYTYLPVKNYRKPRHTDISKDIKSINILIYDEHQPQTCRKVASGQLHKTYKLQ